MKHQKWCLTAMVDVLFVAQRDKTCTVNEIRSSLSSITDDHFLEVMLLEVYSK